MERVYLDNAATTPLFPEVAEAMGEYLKKYYGNPSSLHFFGRESKRHLDTARAQVAKLINARPGDITFTGSGTEGDNLAILGTVRRIGKGHIITSSVEHHAVLNTCDYLSRHGFEVTFLPVDEYGMVTVEELKKAFRPDTILVSVMQGNNEVGTLNPVKELAALTHERGALFHVDAVQSVGKIPVDIKDLDPDFLVYSAHKINGPKGVGVLYKRPGLLLEQIVHGGGQEKKLRSGTENLPGIFGMGMAAELTGQRMERLNKEWQALSIHFIERILKEVPDSKLNGHPTQRLVHNLNLSFKDVDSEEMLLQLDLAGIACSAGSACSASSLETSHVLRAMKLPLEWNSGAIRFSVGLTNTMADIDYTVEVIKEKAAYLREKKSLRIND